MEQEAHTIEQVLAEDRQAFARLIEQYQRLVVHVVYRMVKDPRDREELCQDVFVKVYRSLHTFRYEARLSSWIAKIAYHTCLNHLERKKLPLLDDALPVARLTASEPLPDAQTRRMEVQSFIHKAIERLPHQQRIVLTMYHLEGFSLSEIAHITERPTGTIKSDLFRARKSLKNRLLETYKIQDLEL